MGNALGELLDQLDLEEIDRDLYRGQNPAQRHNRRVFGGMVASQALRGACRTVEVDHHPHSFHGFFLRPGEPGTPIIYHVDRIRDGRSFTTRRVVAVQHAEAIFNMTASFHRDEGGHDYQLALGDVPPPTGVDGLDEAGRMWRSSSPFQVNELGPTAPVDGVFASTRRLWMRANGPVGDDQDLHRCILAYASDMGAVLGAAVPVVGAERWRSVWETHQTASLDHAVWFHRPVRVDDWLYYDMHAVTTQNARGLMRGTIHASDGTLVASVTQEALIRPRR